MMVIHREQQTDPNFVMMPKLPQGGGTRADDGQLESEAALTI